MLKKSTIYVLITVAVLALSILTISFYTNPRPLYFSGTHEAIFFAYDDTKIFVSGEVEYVNIVTRTSFLNPFSNEPFYLECDSGTFGSSYVENRQWGYDGKLKPGSCTVNSGGLIIFGLFQPTNIPARVVFIHSLAGALTAALPILLTIVGIYIYLIVFIKSMP